MARPSLLRFSKEHGEKKADAQAHTELGSRARDFGDWVELQIWKQKTGSSKGPGVWPKPS